MRYTVLRRWINVKKITILALHLSFGGVEKFISNIANLLVEKYDVQIISTYKLADKPAFFINDKVNITYLLDDLVPNREEFKKAVKSLNPFKILKEGIKSLKVLYYKKNKMIEAIKNINEGIIISTRYLHNKLLSKYANKGTTKITTEHNYKLNEPKYVKKVVKSCYNIEYFVAVSKEIKEFYEPKLINTKCIYIPHFLDYIPEELSKLSEKNLVSIGRLALEKGFVDLIKVFKIVNEKHKDWKLYIIGDGEEKEKLKNLIKEYRLEDNIMLTGFKEKSYIYDILSNAFLYIMTSLQESFGIVLLEASSFGVPCIAFDSAKGAIEIIENEKTGYLIENRDISKMAKTINELIENKEKSLELGKNARIKSLQFSQNNIKILWYDLIESIGEINA